MHAALPDNRRVYRRLPTDMSVSYRLSGCGARWREGQALDLSAGGCLLRAEKPDRDVLDRLVREEEKVQLTLSLRGRAIHATARLAWSDRHDQGYARLGLRFLDLDSIDQEFIYRYVLAATAGEPVVTT